MNQSIYNKPMQAGLDMLQKKLYQLIISRLDGDKISLQEYRDNIISLVHKGIGGFILFGGIRHEIKKFIEELQSIAEIPLFIAADIERGVGQQIKGSTNFPSQMAVAAAIDKHKDSGTSILESMIRAIADESIDIGINMPLIPVMDVNKNPDNPIICTRAFSDRPEMVAWFGSCFIKTLQKSGLISCAKHFPGHGDTSIDSHISLPIINKKKADLMRDDIMPFIEAIKANVASIMIGHLTVPELDSKSASLSKKIITYLLRKELGFKGIVITDALNMDALKDFGNVSVNCISAGADILLHPVDADSTVKELLSAVKAEEIEKRQIDNALSNIFEVKRRLRNIKKTEVNYSFHKTISKQITEMSITLIKNKQGILPIKDLDKVQIVFVGEEDIYKSSLLKNYFDSEIPNTNPDHSIFAIFSSVSAWKGSSGISYKEIKRINELIKKAENSILISLGSPYVLRHFKDADLLIAAYEPTEQAQMAVIKCLKGEMSFNGHLPVSL